MWETAFFCYCCWFRILDWVVCLAELPGRPIPPGPAANLWELNGGSSSVQAASSKGAGFPFHKESFWEKMVLSLCLLIFLWKEHSSTDQMNQDLWLLHNSNNFSFSYQWKRSIFCAHLNSCCVRVHVCVCVCMHLEGCFTKWIGSPRETPGDNV